MDGTPFLLGSAIRDILSVGLARGIGVCVPTGWIIVFVSRRVVLVPIGQGAIRDVVIILTVLVIVFKHVAIAFFPAVVIAVSIVCCAADDAISGVVTRLCICCAASE